MISEDYVSLDTAKLLKSKGFNSPCTSFYEEDGSPCAELYASRETDWNVTDELYSRPTLQRAEKWLRYKKNLGIVVDMFFDDGILRYSCLVWQTVSPFELVAQPENIGSFNKHEEALEAAIDYCLKKLI